MNQFRPWLKRINTPSFRLAGLYTIVIMIVSLGFSTLFYTNSMASLKDGGTASQEQVVKKDINGYPVIIDDSGATKIVDETVNKEVDRKLELVKAELLRKLTMLNLEALVFGAVLSYYLARRTLKPIEAAMERQARFSSDASHELRTPIAALRARNEVALRKSGLTLKEAKEVMAQSVEQSIRLEKLADGLLRLSRNRDEPLPVQPVSLEEVANEAVRHSHAAAKAKEITISCDVAADLSVMADRDSLVQVLCILLDNAVKYSPSGTAVSVESGYGDDAYCLHVRDHGIGIAANDLPHIFDRFYRADQSRAHAKKEDGYGLGLSIAKLLVAQNHGVLTARSTPGSGSVFTVELPKVLL